MTANIGKLSPGLREMIDKAKDKYRMHTPHLELIKTKALVYAIGWIQAFPGNRQAYSDMDHMREMVRKLDDYHIAHLLFTVESHMAIEIHLWEDVEEDPEFGRSCFVRQLVQDMKQIDERTAVAA